MSESLEQILWNQFGGALQMLENAIVACPEEVWGAEREFHAFWNLTYHTLFWTNFYFAETTEADFQPPEPFTKDEFDPEGILPERVYTKEEMLEYLEFVWTKSGTFIESLTPERAQERFAGEYRDFSLLELLSEAEAYTGPTHAYTWFISNEPGSGILGTLENVSALVAATEHAELFLYPGNQHYFAGSSLPSYDATAAALLTERVLEFLGNC